MSINIQYSDCIVPVLWFFNSYLYVIGNVYRIFGGTNTITNNCLTENGEYAFNAYQDPSDPQTSATPRVRLEDDCRNLGIPEFDYTQALEDTEVHKPDHRVFEPVLSWLGSKGISPQDATYVGDGLHDMQASLEAGLGFTGITNGLVTAQEFSNHGVPSIQNLSELLASI